MKYYLALGSLLILFSHSICAVVAQPGLGPELDNPLDDCTGEVAEDCDPVFIEPAWVEKRFPTPENRILSLWATKAKDSLAEAFRSMSNSNSELDRVDCCFLVDAKGVISDPIAFPINEKDNLALVLSAISKIKSLPTPPKYLEGRRVIIRLRYPKLRLEVDFHDPVKDRRFFENLRRGKV